ncbi:ATP-binding protein [Anaerobacillus arseniciselenatis]|uniref:ATP-binding protein n=1 Tax=Anaerobacillus arseniciselenatis TaxID=85682 RepID=A0A1S2LNH2_9BACI|nr:diphthine--ammonia ligase [Anaerobacillus arseniciselenatis]OIJ14072.1 ATP-binding protein [Anaerobacillus arseniciselenatis]
MKEKIVVSWSGGKDSAFALHKLLLSDQYEIDSLLTSVTEGYQRISIHGVRESLLEKQAESLGIPLRKMYIPQECTNEIYQDIMNDQLQQLKKEGIETVMFGDIFLDDVRAYREDMIKQQNMKAIFPLWCQKTEQLIEEFISLGFKTVTTSIDTQKLSHEFLGRVIDESFIRELPEHIDPCGENGEFHTFSFAGPIFKNTVDITIGEIVEKGRFHFCELLDSEE